MESAKIFLTRISLFCFLIILEGFYSDERTEINYVGRFCQIRSIGSTTREVPNWGLPYGINYNHSFNNANYIYYVIGSDYPNVPGFEIRSYASQVQMHGRHSGKLIYRGCENDLSRYVYESGSVRYIPDICFYVVLDFDGMPDLNDNVVGGRVLKYGCYDRYKGFEGDCKVPIWMEC